MKYIPLLLLLAIVGCKEKKTDVRAAAEWGSSYSFTHPGSLISYWHADYIEYLVANKIEMPIGGGPDPIKQFWDSVEIEYSINQPKVDTSIFLIGDSAQIFWDKKHKK